MSSGTLSPDPRLRELNDLGLVQSGAKLHTYVSGTPSTPLATYSDVALTIPNANPIVASAGGLFGPIYLTPGVSYKYVLTDALDNALWSQDPIPAPSGTDAIFTGPTAPRTYTLPDANATILTTNAAVTVPQGGTGVATLTAHGVVIGAGTSAVTVTAAGTAGQHLTSNGASADPTFQAGTSLLDKSTTEQVVSNTGSPVSIYSFSVPGGTLGTNKTLRLTVAGEYTNTSGGASTFAVTVTYGATTIASGSLTNFGNGTTGAFRMVIEIVANNATNSQRATAIVTMVPSAAGSLGVFTSSGLVNTSFHDAMAEDSTAAKALAVTVTHGTGATTIIFKAWGRLLELLG